MIRVRQFIINNDYNLANELGAGLHIGQDIRDTAFIKDLDQIRLIGLSCKDDHLQQSRKDHALFSYFSFGPVFESKTKKSLKGTIDINLISKKMNAGKINVAIGGIDSNNISEIKKNGFDMAAICEGIYNDPKKISKNINKLNDIWNETKNSKELFKKSKEHIAGGVNSPVRAFKSVGGTPIFFRKSRDCYLYDEDGNKYIDFVGSRVQWFLDIQINK